VRAQNGVRAPKRALAETRVVTPARRGRGAPDDAPAEQSTTSPTAPNTLGNIKVGNAPPASRCPENGAPPEGKPSAQVADAGSARISASTRMQARRQR
jgi:hypothetical protein